MKFFTILAAAACALSGFVAASPVAVADASPALAASGNELVARGQPETEKDILALLVKLNLEVDTCNKKWG